MAEVVDITTINMKKLAPFYFVRVALGQIFQIEVVDFQIHGDQEETKEMILHCLRLKAVDQSDFDEIDRFEMNYEEYTTHSRSMSCEHMVQCVEDELPSANELADDSGSDLYTQSD